MTEQRISRRTSTLCDGCTLVWSVVLFRLASHDAPILFSFLISIDLVKDALIDTILLSHLSHFLAWTLSLLFLNMHYTVPKPTTANQKILYMHKLFTQIVCYSIGRQ